MLFIDFKNMAFINVPMVFIDLYLFFIDSLHGVYCFLHDFAVGVYTVFISSTLAFIDFCMFFLIVAMVFVDFHAVEVHSAPEISLGRPDLPAHLAIQSVSPKLRCSLIFHRCTMWPPQL